MLSRILAARGSTGDRTVTWHSTSTRGRHTTTRGTILAGGTILARGTIGTAGRRDTPRVTIRGRGRAAPTGRYRSWTGGGDGAGGTAWARGSTSPF